MPFKSLGLTEELIKALTEKGYTKPTSIQEQAIPLILEGSDLMAGSQTGTGKTAGFTLPLLQRLSHSQKKSADRHVRALILTPTRELAAQVAESVVNYGKYLSLKATVIFGGVGPRAQIKELRSGVDIIIATPGRLLDHVSQGNIDLSKIEIFVLDEADRMLDMGFIHDIRKVLGLLPKVRQNLLFSATFSDEIKALADGLLNSPKKIQVARHGTTAEGVTQVVYRVDNKRKRALLSHLILTDDLKQVLVFTRTKHGANRLAEQLTTDGITAMAIHGNKSQSARTKALTDFKQGDIRALVATDIAARGLDIDQLPHVVNYEIPNVPEEYVHRIGRTGRAGNVGKAISLVCIDEHEYLRDIERLLKCSIESIILPGFEPDPSIKAEPIRNGRSQPKGTKPKNYPQKNQEEVQEETQENNQEERDPVSKEHPEKTHSHKPSFSKPGFPRRPAGRSSEGRTKDGNRREDYPRNGHSSEGNRREGYSSEPRAPRSREGNPREERPYSSEPRAPRPREGYSRDSNPREGNPRESYPREGGYQGGGFKGPRRPGPGRFDSREQGPNRFGGNRPTTGGRFGAPRPDSNRSGNNFRADRSDSGEPRAPRSREGNQRESYPREGYQREGNPREGGYQGNGFKGPRRPGPGRFDSRESGPNRARSSYNGNSSEGGNRQSPGRFGPSRVNGNRAGANRADSPRSGNGFRDSNRPGPNRFGPRSPRADRPRADHPRTDRPSSDRSNESFED